MSNVSRSLTRYRGEIRAIQIPNFDVRKQLAMAMVASGLNDDRNRLVETALGLVVRIACGFVKKHGCPYLLEDLIQEGNIGLIMAANTHDPSKGSYTTHAMQWIKQRMGRCIVSQSAGVRIPVHAYERMGGIRQAMMQLRDKLGGEPTVDQLARSAKVTLGNAQEFLEAEAVNTVSLDLRNDPDDRSLGETIPDESPGHDVLIDRLAWAKANDAIVAYLAERYDERDVLIFKLSFGLDGEDELSHEDIGKLVGLTQRGVVLVIERMFKNRHLINFICKMLMVHRKPVDVPKKKKYRKHAVCVN